MNAFLMALCLALSANAAGAPEALDADTLQYKAPVILEGAGQGFVRLTLPGEVIDKLQPSWGDLRLVDDQGRTVPYLLRRDTSPYYALSRPVPGVCQGMTVLEDGTRAYLVDFNSPVRKNRIDLRDWMHDPWPLRIEGSADKNEWSGLLDAEYRVQSRMDASGPLSRWLQLKDGDHRWLRVVYAAGKAPAANTFTAPMLADYVPDPRDFGLVPVSLTVAEPVAPAAKPRPGCSVFEWTVDCRNLPVASTRFVVDDPYFSRQYVLEGSDDGKHWTLISSGTLNRTQWEKHCVDALSTMKGFLTQKRLRLTVTDGDNPPLSVQAPDLWGRTGQLCFDVTGRKAITLFAGNARMTAPNYDLAQSVRDLRFDTLPEVRLGGLEERPADPPEPVEEPADNSRYFMWGMLGVAVCVMLAIVLSSMAAMRRAEGKDGNAPGDER
jgi:hypothetical protein